MQEDSFPSAAVHSTFSTRGARKPPEQGESQFRAADFIAKRVEKIRKPWILDLGF